MSPFAACGVSHDPEDYRRGEKTYAIRWRRIRASVPGNIWLAAVGGLATVTGLIIAGPVADTSAFYGIAAQVVPAFLIALAVERSLLDSLGTKAGYAKSRRDELADSYFPSGIDPGIAFRLGLALEQRLLSAVTGGRLSEADVPVEVKDTVKAIFGSNSGDDSITWSLFRDRLSSEFGLPSEEDEQQGESEKGLVGGRARSDAFTAIEAALREDDPGSSIRFLAAVAAIRKIPEFKEGRVPVRVVGAELKRLTDSRSKAKLDDQLKRVTFAANRDFDERRARDRLSLRVSVVLLGTTELVALAGVLSPARPYSGLFVLSVALVVASIMNVAGGALVDLNASVRE